MVNDLNAPLHLTGPRPHCAGQSESLHGSNGSERPLLSLTLSLSAGHRGSERWQRHQVQMWVWTEFICSSSHCPLFLLIMFLFLCLCAQPLCVWWTWRAAKGCWRVSLRASASKRWPPSTALSPTWASSSPRSPTRSENPGSKQQSWVQAGNNFMSRLTYYFCSVFSFFRRASSRTGTPSSPTSCRAA